MENRKKKKIALHTQILVAMVIGVSVGLLLVFTQAPIQISDHFIKPFGTIFINLLKMIAVPLVFFSLASGVASLSDVSKLSRIGLKTISIYIATTLIAITIGLLLANLVQPGNSLPANIRAELMALYSSGTEAAMANAEKAKNTGPLQILVDIVPVNIVQAFATNTGMLQVVFFSLLLGIALVSINKEKKDRVVAIFDALNDAILKMVNMIMKTAPYGVFALMASLMVDVAGRNPDQAISLLSALGLYSITVLGGLAIMIFVIYPIIIKVFAKGSYRKFLKAIRPAQLLAFSTSSSSAALPVNMTCIERNLGVKEEVSSFVLPLGATINMDGTSLYQAVAVLFISQSLGLDLNFAQQLTILFAALLASIGSAPVPGAGLVMLIVVLESVGIPANGIALILAVDRLLDMARTVVNVTGDACVACVVDATEK